MKQLRRELFVLKIILIIISISTVVVLGSCDLFLSSVSIEERVDAFNDDLTNGNYDSLYTHFSSSIQDYSTMKNTPDSYWDGTGFEVTVGPYVTISSYSVNGDVTGFLKEGTINRSFRFVMIEEGNTYFIKEAYVNNELVSKNLK